MAVSSPPSSCGDTLLHPRLQSLQNHQQRVSRAGLVYGSSFSRGSCYEGSTRSKFFQTPEDMWYDAERFQLDHINEVLTKLNDGSLDDEIWGKIVVMERCKRIAKAYLRKTTIIVDGGDEEFDGKTLGFNHFSNPVRDDYTRELRSKIGDGVIIKIDNQGNIKAMARGSTPVYVQGWKDSKCHCISDKVIRNHGKLMTKTATSAISDEDRVVKIFDMRRFKQCVERDPYESESDARNLLLKTCVRVALVKDGGSTDPMKTPCWFMIINLVALDMLKTKLPSVCSSSVLSPLHGGAMESSKLSRIMSQVSIVPPANDIYSNPALTQLIAAAVQQANSQYAGNMGAQLAATSLPSLNVEQIAKLASTLSLANPSILAAAAAVNSVQQQSNSGSRRIRRSRSFSDSEESEIETRMTQIRSQTAYSGSTTGSSSGISGVGRQKRFDSGKGYRNPMAKSMDALNERKPMESSENTKKNNVDKYGRATRPRLSADLFEKPNIKEQLISKNWKSCASTTSDYDSNREVFDSGSWSSNSRVSTNSQIEPRSYSPSIVSESEPLGTGSRRNSAPNEVHNTDAARERKPVRRVSSTYNRIRYGTSYSRKTAPKMNDFNLSCRSLDCRPKTIQRRDSDFSDPVKDERENLQYTAMANVKNVLTEEVSQRTWTNHHKCSQQNKTNPTWFMSLRPTPSQRLSEHLYKEGGTQIPRYNNSTTTSTNSSSTTSQKNKLQRPPPPPPKPKSIQEKFRQLQQEFLQHPRFHNSSDNSRERNDRNPKDRRESSQSNSANIKSRVRQIQELQTTNTEGGSLEPNRPGDRFLRMPQPESESMWGESSPGRASVFRTLLKQFGAVTFHRGTSPDRGRNHIPSQKVQQSNQQPGQQCTLLRVCEHGESRVRSPTKSRQFEQNRMQLLRERSRSSTYIAMAPPTEQELVQYVANPNIWNQSKTAMLYRTSSPHIESMDPMSVQQWDRQYIDGFRGTVGCWEINSPHRHQRRLSGDPGRVRGTNTYHRGNHDQQFLRAWDLPRRPASAAYGTFTQNFNSRNSTTTAKQLRRC